MPRTETQGAPLRLDPAVLAGQGLEEFPPPPNPPEGTHGHVLTGVDSVARLAGLFEGDVVVQVVESGPKKFIVDGAGFDEFIHILAGNLILTDDKGVEHEYGPGDNLVMPKEFKGTWENTGDVYQELIVIETKTYEQALQQHFAE